jgi:hypothetical protein
MHVPNVEVEGSIDEKRALGGCVLVPTKGGLEIGIPGGGGQLHALQY